MGSSRGARRGRLINEAKQTNAKEARHRAEETDRHGLPDPKAHSSFWFWFQFQFQSSGGGGVE